MLWADFRLKLIRLFRKYSKLIFFGLLVWATVLAVNSLLKDYEPEEKLDVSYSPHTSVMNSEEKIPKDLEQPINKLIDTFFTYCQNKQYDSAYNLILDGCKKQYFRTLSEFKEYVDLVFNEEKTYYIQNYSNYKGNYVYQIRIFENIMRTGLTGKNDISFYEEKISIQNEDGQLKLGLRQYISTEKLDQVYEDNYVKIWLLQKDTFYESERYTVKIKNKSEFIDVLYDGTEMNEASLNVGNNLREAINSNLNIVLQPGDTETYEIDFQKFYDETYISKSIIFDAVRILKTYSGLEVTRDYELEHAEELYSIEIPF